MSYTIKQIRSIDDVGGKLAEFLVDTQADGYRLDDAFDWNKFDMLDYARRGMFLVCYRRGQPVGVMLARLYSSVFDPTVTILFQDILYVRKSSGRAAFLLLKAFIDFGRANADLVFTMVTKNSNLKGTSLEKLGFVRAEVLYRMEFK